MTYSGCVIASSRRWNGSDGDSSLTFFMSGVRPSTLDVMLGLPMSVAVLQVIASSFAEVILQNTPAGGVAIAAVGLGVAALTPCIPAPKAAQVDPLVAIRSE